MKKLLLMLLVSVAMPALATATPYKWVIDDFTTTQARIDVEYDSSNPANNVASNSATFTSSKNPTTNVDFKRTMSVTHLGYTNQAADGNRISGKIKNGLFMQSSEAMSTGQWGLTYQSQTAGETIDFSGDEFNAFSVNLVNADHDGVATFTITMQDGTEESVTKNFAANANSFDLKFAFSDFQVAPEEFETLTGISFNLTGSAEGDYTLNKIGTMQVDVPEPMTLSLLAAGGFGMLIRRRKKRA